MLSSARNREDALQKKFTFRFYSLSKNSDTTPDFAGELRSIAKIQDRAAREKTLSAFYTVRLEELEDDGTDAVVGELVRCQVTNLPAELKGGKRSALKVEKLAHGVVFRYNFKKGTLGVQYDPSVISPGRLLEYVSAFNANAIYAIAPKIDPKNWAKFNSGTTRKLSIRIANPESMAEVSGQQNQSAAAGMKALAGAYDAPSIYIELSMGHRKGHLSAAITDFAEQLASMSVPGFRLDKLSAVTVVNDASDEIDLIQERLVASEELDIHDRDPDTNYKIKRDYLIAQMKNLVG